jgi:hypothetical protein
MDTASMLMRGITEEQQIAMAIAASLEQESTQTRTPSEGTSDRSGETSENEQESSSAAAAAIVTAALADTTEGPPSTLDGALAEPTSDASGEIPAEEIPVTASVPSGNESPVTPTVDEIPFPSIEVGVEEIATSGQEDTCASAADDLVSLDPLTVKEPPPPSVDDTEASAELLDATAESSKDAEDAGNADESTLPTDGDASERENSMFQA